MVKLFLIEDQKLLVDGLETALNGDESFEVVGSISDAALALPYLGKHPADMMLSDICTANNHNVLDYIPDIKKAHPSLKIVLITAFPEIGFIERARELKVDSFVYKNIPTGDLIAVLKNTALNYSSYPSLESPKNQVFIDLSEKEIEILRLFCAGENRKEIAKSMCLSESTIKNYVTGILEKTGFSSMAKLALYSVKNGFIL